jgi:hypothetical protein
MTIKNAVTVIKPSQSGSKVHATNKPLGGIFLQGKTP